jgi:hypothetical protein
MDMLGIGVKVVVAIAMWFRDLDIFKVALCVHPWRR